MIRIAGNFASIISDAVPLLRVLCSRCFIVFPGAGSRGTMHRDSHALRTVRHRGILGAAIMTAGRNCFKCQRGSSAYAKVLRAKWEDERGPFWLEFHARRERENKNCANGIRMRTNLILRHSARIIDCQFNEKFYKIQIYFSIFKIQINADVNDIVTGR